MALFRKFHYTVDRFSKRRWSSRYIKNYLNSLLVGETQKILKETMGLDFWYESIQLYGNLDVKESDQARIASITYAYMIGDFPSVINQTEELQFAGIRKTYLDFLWLFP